MKFFLFSIFCSILTSFKPGEPVGTLTCKSESGRTIFTAILPSCSYLEKAELSVDGSKSSFMTDDATAKVIFDPENKVFTVYIESINQDPKIHKFLQLWAIPSTFKKTSGKKGPGTEFHDTYAFKAKLFGTDPRKNTDLNTPTIELNCILDYEL
mgnify:CR=1 FL=1